MAIWKVSLRKAFGTPFNQKWSNTYYVEGANLTEAADISVNIWNNWEREFHTQGVYCYEIYLNNTADPPNSPGSIFPIPAPNQRGVFPGYNAGATFPLWNCLRCDFTVLNSRPSRKFFRVGLVPANYDNGNITAGLASTVQASLTGIAAQIGVVDVDGEQIIAGVIKGLTPHRLGKEAGLNVPAGPPFG